MRENYSLKKLQFRVLYRVFLLRVVDLELLSADGDTTKLLGQFAALFAAVSFMFTAPLILFGGGLPQDDILTMEHFLIATTMVVISLFSVLNWDSIFPDRRDVLVLAPLPVRANTLFLAKLASLAFAMALSVVALNVFTGLVWPAVIFAPHAGVVAACQSAAAYWITIFAAAAFIFFSVLAVQGVTALLLPRQQFLRLSALLQVAAFCLFVGVYILEPSLQDPSLLATPESQRVLDVVAHILVLRSFSTTQWIDAVRAGSARKQSVDRACCGCLRSQCNRASFFPLHPAKNRGGT